MVRVRGSVERSVKRSTGLSFSTFAWCAALKLLLTRHGLPGSTRFAGLFNRHRRSGGNLLSRANQEQVALVEARQDLYSLGSLVFNAKPDLDPFSLAVAYFQDPRIGFPGSDCLGRHDQAFPSLGRYAALGKQPGNQAPARVGHLDKDRYLPGQRIGHRADPLDSSDKVGSERSSKFPLGPPHFRKRSSSETRWSNEAEEKATKVWVFFCSSPITPSLLLKK